MFGGTSFRGRQFMMGITMPLSLSIAAAALALSSATQTPTRIVHVDPARGDDRNTGLTRGDPLATVFAARDAIRAARRDGAAGSAASAAADGDDQPPFVVALAPGVHAIDPSRGSVTECDVVLCVFRRNRPPVKSLP